MLYATGIKILALHCHTFSYVKELNSLLFVLDGCNRITSIIHETSFVYCENADIILLLTTYSAFSLSEGTYYSKYESFASIFIPLRERLVSLKINFSSLFIRFGIPQSSNSIEIRGYFPVYITELYGLSLDNMINCQELFCFSMFFQYFWL